ncbi:hypothetical protein AWB76_07619 [Caballeronia temeraria]|uniref:Uncharacterized protein n=1 Tax=Caballeronia temeraria TaxID=1777137 RepID=A0A158DWN0_9BURK|nr:hypothetical protein AWB76_07619 [Caballeronia temeraria]
MNMRLIARTRKVLCMPVMLIMTRPVRVLEHLVSMLMLMAFTHMKPDAECHQHSGNPERYGG